MTRERREIVFAGRVQGVGFRMTTHRAASGRDVAGWVRNEPDGTVRCVIEGEADVIDAFLEDLRARMAGHIDRERVERTAARGGFAGFEIR